MHLVGKEHRRIPTPLRGTSPFSDSQPRQRLHRGRRAGRVGQLKDLDGLRLRESGKHARIVLTKTDKEQVNVNPC